MQLTVHETGSGPKTAVLIHGIMADSRAWHRVSYDLIQHGFRVLSVDLAGHGMSPRSRWYSPTRWADDVIETVAPFVDGRPDLVMGHSLGALIASRVAEKMVPGAVIYVDPTFAFPSGIKGWMFKLGVAIRRRPNRQALEKAFPKWNTADIDIELASLRVWDRRTLLGLANTRCFTPPARLAAPSLVVLAEPSLLVTDDVAATMRRRGMTVETVRDAGHTVFRDDHSGFMNTVVGWLRGLGSQLAPAPVG